MNIDHKEDTKEWEVFLNTEVEEVQSTLQFSTSVEVRPGNSQLQLSSGLGMLVLTNGEPTAEKIVKNKNMSCFFCYIGLLVSSL